MQMLIELPDGKMRLKPLTIDSEGYILDNGQRIRDNKSSVSPSKSHMVHKELKKLETKIANFLTIFRNASKRNQNIVHPLFDQHRVITNLFTILYNKASDKSRFRIPKSFYDEVRKLDSLLTQVNKHIKHKPKNKFDTVLLKYFYMMHAMMTSLGEIEKCPVPRYDAQGYCMEPLSTTNRDFKNTTFP